MIWAITRKDGRFTIHFDDPAKCHRAEAKRANVWKLDREPDVTHGEIVDHSTGQILFSADAAMAQLLREIKMAAMDHILRDVPLWRQLNDQLEPDAPGAAERRAKVRAVRDWSAEKEAQLAAATSVEDVLKIRGSLIDWTKP